ncbi:SCAN domain-containing protein 3-like [Aphis craccivora]|uniref:SCAN domain-containing protein 3-like n=1 Tax=Aphis craccivora TaxID=307492 RepID=A0A6G0Y523_APHCR|nr:SCAN domain-containing protein 3-like [Aphis craccivora]
MILSSNRTVLTARGEAVDDVNVLFLFKKRKLENGVPLNTSIEKDDDPVASTSVVSKVVQENKQPTPILVLKYLDNYLSFGFTFNGPENRPVPQLSNEFMVPSKRKRHLSSKHSHLLVKDKNYFIRLLSSEEKQAKTMVRRATISEKALLASYKVSEIVAKRMQPHTIAEDVILPACKEIVKSMLGDNAEKEISLVPLSNDTVSRRIGDMSSDIQCHVREKFIDDDSVIEQFLACSELPTTSTGADVYDSMSNTLIENGLSWKNCLSVCTDGAPAMTEKFKGFVAKVKQNFPNVGSTHCFRHHEALMVKTIPAELKSVLNLVVNMVNFVKSRALKTRLLKEMCHEAGSKYDTLVLHTEIRWLLKGKVLQRFYELKNELSKLFSTEKPDFAAYLNDTEWCAKVAYLADIFYH